MLLRKPRSAAEVYNDLDGEVVNVFRVLRDRESATRLAELVRLTPWARDEWIEAQSKTEDPVEQARRTIARTFFSHGSMHRQGNRTGFRARNLRSLSSAPKEWAEWPEHLTSWLHRLRGVTIENRDALKVIEQQDSPETLFYVDPPYPIEARTSMRWPSDIGKGYSTELTDADHRTLAAALHEADGMVLVSGYRCRLLEELYGDWNAVEKLTISDGAKKRTEVLWLNPACFERLPQSSLIEACQETA